MAMRTPWELPVALEPGSRVPVFLQIARAVADDARRGRLRPGDALPGSRALAQTIGVHRNTVLAAYHELAAEGWVATTRARGTYVSAALPEVTPRRFARTVAPREYVPARPGFELGREVPAYATRSYARGVIELAGGTPDVRLLPRVALARAQRRVLRGASRALLGYADPRGEASLREALARMVSSLRGLAATRESVMVTRGSQMAIDLCARALVAPGDVVAVEAVGYRPAWEALRLAGARLVPVPVDASGLRTDALGVLCARERVRAVYVTPHHQYPTTAVMTPGRRLALLELARAHRFAVLEDDYDHEFHYDGRPVLPLASADHAGVVVYIGTLSKMLAPGLRLGFLVAPVAFVERVAALRVYVDRQGDHVLERAVAELLEDGEVARHARRARLAYLSRRDALCEALRTELGSTLDVRVPEGGLALWARAADGVDVEAWRERALAHGVAVTTARDYAFDGRARPYLRLGFALHTERELREAARRLRAALSAKA